MSQVGPPDSMTLAENVTGRLRSGFDGSHPGIAAQPESGNGTTIYERPQSTSGSVHRNAVCDRSATYQPRLATDQASLPSLSETRARAMQWFHRAADLVSDIEIAMTAIDSDIHELSPADHAPSMPLSMPGGRPRLNADADLRTGAHLLLQTAPAQSSEPQRSADTAQEASDVNDDDELSEQEWSEINDLVNELEQDETTAVNVDGNDVEVADQTTVGQSAARTSIDPGTPSPGPARQEQPAPPAIESQPQPSGTAPGTPKSAAPAGQELQTESPSVVSEPNYTSVTGPGGNQSYLRALRDHAGPAKTTLPANAFDKYLDGKLGFGKTQSLDPRTSTLLTSKGVRVKLSLEDGNLQFSLSGKNASVGKIKQAFAKGYGFSSNSQGTELTWKLAGEDPGKDKTTPYGLKLSNFTMTHDGITLYKDV